MHFGSTHRDDSQLFWMVLAGVVVACLVAWACIHEHLHPCIRWGAARETTCGGGMSCAFMNEDGCQMWTFDPTYPCRISDCLERK